MNSLRSPKPFLKYILAILVPSPHSNLAFSSVCPGFYIFKSLFKQPPSFNSKNYPCKFGLIKNRYISTCVLRSELQRQDTLTKAVIAALGVTTITPHKPEDDRDDQTVRGVSMGPEPDLVDTSIFDILSEFKLDLCLSPPASPDPSVSDLPPSTPSPPLSPTLSRSISFTSAKAATVTKKSMKKKSSKMSSTAPSRSRGSWPLVKYTGRGTPVDRRRRLEWGGFSSEDVAEDGLLFAPGIRYSDDSTSPESPSVDSSVSHSSHAHFTTLMAVPSIYEPAPELGPLEIESSAVRRSEEWEHIMKSVLATTTRQIPDVEDYGDSQVPAFAGTSTTAEEEPLNSTQIRPLKFSIMSKEQVEELNSGLEAELGLNAALDLGFAQEPGNGSKWFNSNLLHLPGSSRASSPSVYSSQAVTLRKRSPIASRASYHRSASSTKAEADVGETDLEAKLLSNPWWRRMFTRLRRVQTLFTFPKTLF